MSTLSAFPYIQERSEATPGLWNLPFSILSANMAALNVASGFSSISVTTLAASSVSMSGMVKLNADSGSTDYLFFRDSSNARSNYILGSHVGSTADGLNIYDVSGSTMIVGFSKQSTRFYGPIYAPIFDSGGASFNVKSFGAQGDGVTDDTAAFRLAISAATAISGGIVLVPSSRSVYIISSTLTLGANVAMIGGGGYNPTLRFNNGAGKPCLSFLGTTEAEGCNCSLQNLTLLGGNNHLDVGIRLRNFSNFFLHRVDISHFSAGIWADWGQAVYVDECSISLNSFGVHLGGVGPSGGIRSGNTDFMDWVHLRNCQFALNQVDVEHKGSHAAHGVLTLVGNEFFESVAVSNKTYFVHAAGLKAFTAFGNTWESGFSRACIMLDKVDTENVSQGTVYGGSIFGNEMLLNGGSGTTGVWLKAAQQIDCFGNAFEALGNAVAYDLADGSNTNAIGTSSYSGPSITPVASKLYSVVEASGFSSQRPYTGDGTVDQSSTSNKIRLYGGPNARLQLFPAGSSNSAFELDNTPIDATTPQLRVYTQGAVTLSVLSRQLVMGLDGTALSPIITQTSERSLGWWRSGNSLMNLSYGTLIVSSLSVANAVMVGSTLTVAGTITTAGAAGVVSLSANPMFQLGKDDGTQGRWQVSGGNTYLDYLATWNIRTITGGFAAVMTLHSGGSVDFAQAVTLAAGTALAPGLAYTSETSLGFFRSAASTMALSYGTLKVGELYVTGSGISIGNATAGGSLIPAISSTSSLVAAFVVQGSASSFTVITWAAAQPYDHILVTPGTTATVSSLSSGLVAHSHCTKAGHIEFRLSNASTLVQNQSTRTWYFTRISPF